jgi:hypothetical protein
MILIDVLRDENKNDHLENLKKLIKWIEEHETHRNSSNYFNLHEKINQFDSFELLYDGNNIIGFSGLYNNGYYSKNCARSSTRTYYHPEYRNKGMSRTYRWSEDYFIPYEVSVAEKLGYDYVFISVELLIRRRSLNNLVSYLNKTRSWILHPDMCNTCRQVNDQGTFIGVNNDPGCWQNVCYTKIRECNELFDIPTLDILSYKELYGKDQISKIKKLR